MCKQIKRLTELSQCAHINKTDRDAIIFLLRETCNIKVEADKGFDGFDFSSWPSIPKKTIIRDWVKTRKSKNKSIITQTFIESCAAQLTDLKDVGISVDRAISFAANDGWQGFKASWVLKKVEKNKTVIGDLSKEPKTPADWIRLVKKGMVTHRSKIPGEHRKMIDTQYMLGNYQPEVMELLEKIGFAV